MWKILRLRVVKKNAIAPFDRWRAILSSDLLDLQQLGAQDAFTRMKRAMKEQELGQHCCQAGEELSDADLELLKKTHGLDEQQWHIYKSRVRPAPE